MEFLGLEVNYLEEEGFKVYFRDLMNLSRTSFPMNPGSLLLQT